MTVLPSLREARRLTDAADEPSTHDALTSSAGRRVFFAKRLLVIVISLVVALAFLEALARIIVTLGRPAQSGSEEFDSKWQVAARTPNGPRPTLFFTGT